MQYTFLSNMKHAAQMFVRVYADYRNVLVAAMTSIIAVMFFVWISAHELIRYALLHDSFSLSAKIKILFFTLGSFITNFTHASQIITIIISVLIGINISLLAHHIKTRTASKRAQGGAGLGLFVGILGIGCSACGSVLLTSLFGISATTGLLSILPLGGLEFGLSSIAILFISNIFMLKKTETASVCCVPLTITNP